MEPRGLGLIAVGRIVRPQGRKGEVRVESLTDEPDRFRHLRECYLVPPEAGERRTVEAAWLRGGTPVLKLGGSESISDAQSLVGRLVTIPPEAARPLPPDRFYAFDLIGCTVESPEGMTLGVLTEVQAGAAHDLWVLRAGERECPIPAVAAIVERVDLARRVVVARLPEGLLELDA